MDRKTAKKSEQNAQELLDLAQKYYDGDGVEQDYEKAVAIFNDLAEAGNASAQNSLAICYDRGHGVPQDYVKAVEWYTKAAEAGNVEAQFNLAMCYENGNGAPQDHEKAIEWYEKAAEHKMGKANLCLAVYYEKNRDYTKAIEYYTKAVKQGVLDAQQSIDNIKKRYMTKEEFEESIDGYLDEYLENLKDIREYDEGSFSNKADIDKVDYKGVYIIFDKDGKAIYIGDAITDKFTIKSRLNIHLKGHESNATVVNLLLNNKIFEKPEDAKKYLKDECSFIAIKWESLEYFLIKKVPNLLNKKGKN